MASAQAAAAVARGDLLSDDLIFEVNTTGLEHPCKTVVFQLNHVSLPRAIQARYDGTIEGFSC